MSIPRFRPAVGAVAGALLLALTAACSDDPVSPDGASTSRTRADTLDTRATGAATGTRWVYVDLDDPARPLQLTDVQAASSGAWDIAFNGFGTRTNLTGGVAAYCLCQNTSQPGIDFAALTADSERADFDAVTRAQIPADAQFRADTLLGINDWVTVGSNGARSVAPNVYVLQRPDGLGYAKLEVTAVQSATGSTPGRITFRWATTNAARAGFSATRTATVDVSADARLRFNLDAGAPVTSGPWDVAFQGWRIQTNSGASTQAGTPSWGAYNATALLRVTSFDALATNSVSPTSNAYRPDGYGVFGERPTWSYTNGAGGARLALPTFDVYLVKRGSTVYKLQVTGYKKQVGSEILDNFVGFRSARITD